MKNTMKLFATTLFVAALALSCQRNFEEQSYNKTEPEFITVTATIADVNPDSKVTLENDGAVGKTKWVNGDEVFFHGAFVGTSGDDKYSYVATAHDVSVDGKTASFTIPAIAKRFNSSEIGWRSATLLTDLYAVYPASAVADFSNGDEWYFVSAFKNTNNFLLAGCNNTLVDGGNTFTFMNLVGALSFKVNSDGISGGFDSYSVSGNGGETVGYTNYCVKMDIDGSKEPAKNDFRTLYTGTDGPGPSSGALTSIVVGSALTPWTGHDGSTINTVYFPNGVNFASGFTIKFFKSGSEVRRVQVNSGVNIAVAKYLDLGDVTSHLFTYVPPAKHDSSIGCPADDSEYDLSKTASANCYIVDGSVAANTEKVFKFKAYKGKGTTKVGTIDSVSLLWETWNNGETVTKNSVIAAVDYDKQSANDYYEICFKMPETLHAGNAVIAAKNALGEILWSWHIWVPETTIGLYTGDAHTSNMMSRNLGALKDTEAGTSLIDVECIGLFYQWGRKDPFVGPRVVDADYPSGATINGESMSTSTGQISLAESIKNPTKYGVYAGDWCSDHDSEYWGDTGSKSMYDPCPPGYRVPKRVKSGTNLWSDTTLKTSADWTTAGWAYDGTYHWFTVGTPAAVFPLTGYMDSGTYNRVTSRTVIWNAHPDGDDNAYNRYVYYESGNPQGRNYSHNKSRGYSVRCAVE